MKSSIKLQYFVKIALIFITQIDSQAGLINIGKNTSYYNPVRINLRPISMRINTSIHLSESPNKLNLKIFEFFKGGSKKLLYTLKEDGIYDDQNKNICPITYYTQTPTDHDSIKRNRFSFCEKPPLMSILFKQIRKHQDYLVLFSHSISQAKTGFILFGDKTFLFELESGLSDSFEDNGISFLRSPNEKEKHLLQKKYIKGALSSLRSKSEKQISESFKLSIYQKSKKCNNKRALEGAAKAFLVNRLKDQDFIDRLTIVHKQYFHVGLYSSVEYENKFSSPQAINPLSDQYDREDFEIYFSYPTYSINEDSARDTDGDYRFKFTLVSKSKFNCDDFIQKYSLNKEGRQ